MLKLEFSTDGRRFLGGQVVPWLSEERCCTLDDGEWVAKRFVSVNRKGFTDFTKPWTFFAYPADKPAEKVLLATSQRAQHLFGDRFKGVVPRLIGVDAHRRIYVVFEVAMILGPVPEPEMLSYVLRDGTRVKLEAGFGYVLTVFDSRGRTVQQTEVVKLPQALAAGGWVQPLPDGSGYYELRLLEREAQVVFHPLPAP